MSTTTVGEVSTLHSTEVSIIPMVLKLNQNKPESNFYCNKIHFSYAFSSSQAFPKVDIRN